MAFLRTHRRVSGNYYAVVESYRRDGSVRQRILEYIGKDPDPARLKRALVYWKVKDRTAFPNGTAAGANRQRSLTRTRGKS
jgi:hypothetical protein